jgi:dolichol-phosphate mannosyltransferase
MLGTELSDPMSGFFMLRREIVETHAARLMPEGFKILLDIATTAGPSLRIAEEAYSFRERFAGESKFDVRIGLEFLGLILSKLSFGVVNPRFLIFALVGTTGLGVHLLALKGGLLMARLVFPAAQALATFTAMGNNFLLNNLLTYRDRRLRGLAMFKGFAGYCVIGAAGALANVGVAAWLYSEQPVWWAAGLAGAFMGALWNYSMSSRLVWRAQ